MTDVPAPQPVAPHSAPRSAARPPWLVPGAIGAGALAILVAALLLGGGSPKPAPQGIPDPGPVTGWGLPISTLATNIGIVGAIGALLVGVLMAPAQRDERGEAHELSGVGLRCLRHAGRWAALWFAGSVAGLLFGLSDVMGLPVGKLDTAMLRSYLSVDLGRAQLAVVVLGAIVALLARWTLSLRGGALLFLCALGALVPPALSGHAAAAGNHDLATSSLFVHLVGASLWVGGLVAVVLVARRSKPLLAALLPRFSALALWCFVAVAISGVANAWLRLGAIGELWGSRYGWLVIGKVAALAALGAFGYLHRRRYVTAIAQQRPMPSFVAFVMAEIAVMAAAVGLATALGRTPTPVQPLTSPSPAELLIGYPIPELTPARLLWGGRPDILVIGALLAVTFAYFGGVRRLRARGDHWPIGRAIAFGCGLALVAYSVCGPLAIYGQATFSAHMMQHMFLTMAAPILLGLGAPITLAMRALPTRGRAGNRGAREWLMAALHSRVTRFFTHPLIALTLYIVTLYGFYFTPVFDWSMKHHSVHLLMHVHFLAIGMLFFWVVLGIDPVPRKIPHLGRVGLLLVSVPFHAFFGVTIMTGATILAHDWFSALQLPWVHDLLADQRVGGGIAWSFGEIPTVMVLAAIFVQWYRADEREAARRSRRPEAEDAALAAYNAHLAELNRRAER